MNCPHHHKFFAAVPRSYRDLPLRLAEYGTCYRYEQSGELFGLMRVRSMQMNDAHIYCTEEQFEVGVQRGERDVSEIFQALRHREISDALLARTIRRKLGQKFVDEPELWKQDRGDDPRRPSTNSGINYVEVPNEAAFYGPKIDVQVWSVIGREFTIATNQVDFAAAATFRSRLQRPRQHREDAALHSSRAARHARTFHRLPDRTLRRQLPALARARTGPHPPDRRRTRRCSNTPAQFKPNSAPIKSAASSTPAATRSRQDRRTPSK